MNRDNLKKTSAIVTGASSGIGLEISRKLGAMGYEVFGFGRDFRQEPLWEEEGFQDRKSVV